MHATTESARDATMVEDEAPSTKVVSAIAEAKGVDPLELDPLYDYVDTDALDAIFSQADASSSLELRFSVADYQVVVSGAGEVAVTPPTSEDDAATVGSCGD
jgi:hypothetical protein